MSTLAPTQSPEAPSLLRSLLVATATVAFLALSLGALYLQSEPPPASASVSVRR